MAKLQKIPGLRLLSIFYFVTGIVLLITLTQSSSTPLHIPLIGVLSLINSFAVSKWKRLSIYLTAIITLSSITFSCLTVYAVLQTVSLETMEILIVGTMILYCVALTITFIYLIKSLIPVV